MNGPPLLSHFQGLEHRLQEAAGTPGPGAYDVRGADEARRQSPRRKYRSHGWGKPAEATRINNAKHVQPHAHKSRRDHTDWSVYYKVRVV